MPEESMDTGKIHKQQANDDLDNESEASSFTSAEFLISNKEDSSYQISKNKQQSLKPICYQHLATISKLQREIEKVKKVSSRRLKKINSLSKRSHYKAVHCGHIAPE
ncbi:unnamed protein product [Pieris brassicae]|uniref:Uncharacterized protein n=1 Tax=Pieris brassicae TaxID=7116 RepID=A0A9P0TPU5_PIEBR|nr:unnamed protein product [Pieris brassicae]